MYRINEPVYLSDVNTLKRYISAFGLYHGIRIFIQLKLLRFSSVRLPGISTTLYLRPGSIDLYSLDEIFIQQVYRIPPSDKPFQPAFIVDGGANIGFTSVFLAHVYPHARILAVEPEEGNLKLLRKNVEELGNVQVVAGGIWSKSCKLRVKDEGYGLRGFTVEETTDEDPLGVPAYSVDDLMKLGGSEKIGLLKLDIEGSEKEVFSGHAENWLPFTECIAIELHDRMVPGCSDAVYGALGNEWMEELAGGNSIFRRR